MKARLAGAIAEMGRLVRYPAAGYTRGLEALVAAIETGAPEAARRLADFGSRVAGLSVDELQELFTRTFDLNPLCALEIGWHLYGDDYARGAFLVRLRQALRRHGVEEGGELPDHLGTVLALLPRLDQTEATELVAAAVRPALERMRSALAGAQSPFEPLLDAIDAVLGAWTAGERTQTAVEAPLPPGWDVEAREKGSSPRRCPAAGRQGSATPPGAR